MQKISSLSRTLCFSACYFILLISYSSIASENKYELTEADRKIAEAADSIKSEQSNGSNQELSQTGYMVTDEDRALIKQSNAFKAGTGSLSVPKNIHTDYAAQQAKAILQQAQAPAISTYQLNDYKNASKNNIYVFVSWSLGESSLKQIMKLASNNPDIYLVFRGVKDVADIGGSMRELLNMAAKYDPIPNVMLNPPLFGKFSISQVPSIVVYNDSSEKIVAKVAGHSDPSWLLQRIKDGESGDQGFKGPSIQIAERDLIEVMKERALAINWEEKRAKAKQNFWKKQVFVNMPTAPLSNSRILDPTIVITADIPDGKGGVLIPQGTAINPLDMKPFGQALIIFDPLDKAQVSVAKDKLSTLRKNGVRTTLIVTRIDAKEGWASYKKITDSFDSPVFKLTPDIQQRFSIKAVPSIVTANKTHFIIEEIAANHKDGK
jgi:conjugal transfer pilus assembly protein TraW